VSSRVRARTRRTALTRRAPGRAASPPKGATALSRSGTCRAGCAR
jgi:hypothetical protein